MDIKKLLMGGIVGGILFFLLGWLVYGTLLMDFFKSHAGTATNVDKTEMDYLYLSVGNLAQGFLVAYIFVKANVSSLANGLVTGGIVGLLGCVAVDCITYGLTNITSKTAMAADVAAFTVISAVVGAIVGAMMGMGKKAA